MGRTSDKAKSDKSEKKDRDKMDNSQDAVGESEVVEQNNAKVENPRSIPAGDDPSVNIQSPGNLANGGDSVNRMNFMPNSWSNMMAWPWTQSGMAQPQFNPFPQQQHPVSLPDQHNNFQPQMDGLNNRLSALERSISVLVDNISERSGRKSTEHSKVNENYEDISDVDMDYPEKHGADSVSVPDSPDRPSVASDVFSKAFASVKVGSPLDEDLADFLHKSVTSAPDRDFLMDTKEQFLRPENCPTLVVPRVNDKVWEKTKMPIRQLDLKLQDIQSNMVSSVYAMSSVVSQLKKLQEENPECPVTKELHDSALSATFMASHASYKMSMQRRFNFKSVFDQNHINICTKNDTPPTDLLFGSDLAKSCKEISDESAAFGRVFNKKPQYNSDRNRSNSDNNNNSRGRKSFRGNRRAPYWVGRNNFRRDNSKPSTSKSTYKPKN